MRDNVEASRNNNNIKQLKGECRERHVIVVRRAKECFILNVTLVTFRGYMKFLSVQCNPVLVAKF